MPIVTRSQNKNVSNVPVAVPKVSTPITDELFRRIVTYPPAAPPTINISANVKDKFATDVKKLLDECDLAVGRENKVKIALKIFKTINDDLDKIISAHGVNVWIRFICAVYNKVMEFEADFQKDSCLDVDKNLLDSFKTEISEAKKKVIPIIKCYTGAKFVELVNDTKKKINEQENMRPRRNVPRVDYTGMDSIEPESEFDGITNIWADETIEEDPDYVFEEDEDEDEDEEDDSEFQQKVKPELSAEEKSELKQHLSQLVDSHRVRRNVARVNYAGMDMNEEDEGQLHIAKRWFEDGKVKYIWKSYSLSQANEIDDEDYVDEE